MTWLPKNFFVCSGSGTCIRWIPFYIMAVNQKIKMTSTCDKNKNVPHESQADTGKNRIFCVI